MWQGWTTLPVARVPDRLGRTWPTRSASTSIVTACAGRLLGLCQPYARGFRAVTAELPTRSRWGAGNDQTRRTAIGSGPWHASRHRNVGRVWVHLASKEASPPWAAVLLPRLDLNQ